MPVGDWQFWVVSLIAALGLVVLVWSVLPKRKRRSRTELTISGGKPRKPGSVGDQTTSEK